MSTFSLTLKSFICRIKFVKSIETFLYLHGLISASIWVLRVLGFFSENRAFVRVVNCNNNIKVLMTLMLKQ